MKNKKSRKILFYATILLLLAVNLFPFLIMLMTSFKDSQEAIATTQTIFPKEWTFEHYQDIFNAEIFPFIMYFKNSLVISLIASVTAVVIGISGHTLCQNYASKLARKSMLAFIPSICFPVF